jgi:hypothetical protein
MSEVEQLRKEVAELRKRLAKLEARAYSPVTVTQHPPIWPDGTVFANGVAYLGGITYGDGKVMNGMGPSY